MRLTQLQIDGFKSFPERAALVFDDGVTAIVGPNGCGKSNVIDAITWVLGEQSARSLRGERMEDVIFSGSDARRPTAAAEVKVQLSRWTAALAGDGYPLAVAPGGGRAAAARNGRNGNGNGNGHSAGNGNGRAIGNGNGRRHAHAKAVGGPGDDSPDAPAALRARVRSRGRRFDRRRETPASAARSSARDVEVGRRLYRSRRERVSHRRARLPAARHPGPADGPRHRRQGLRGHRAGSDRRDARARPTERRQLLEEAAGVTKYKTRRRTAALKLEAAQQNLTRVDDIVFRGREAAQRAQAPGREGAPVPPAARRVAALAEGLVRAPERRAGA